MKRLVANTIALIGACESKYALMGDENDKKETETKEEAQLKSVAENAGIRAPAGIRLEEIDIRVDVLIDAIADFDRTSALALEGAAALHDLGGPQIDIMPRMETFLISSFLLNLRQAALHTLGMLRHSRVLVERRQERHGRKRIYLPQINWRKWLQSGGEADMLALPDSARKDARTGNKIDDDADDGASIDSGETLLAKKDVESATPRKEAVVQSSKIAKETVKRRKKGTRMLRLRNRLATRSNIWLVVMTSHMPLKLTVAVFLGLWAALQLVLITEVAIGTSVMMFMLRAVGTTVGCTWGYAAYQAGQGNRVVAVVLIVIGIIPSAYVQLGSKIYQSRYGHNYLNVDCSSCYRRPHCSWLSYREFSETADCLFFIGGIVALVVEVALFPVKARDRLVESLACSIRQITEMEACLAYGIETEINNVNVRSPAVVSRFSMAKGKAEAALAAAEAFLPFCANEPRLKGFIRSSCSYIRRDPLCATLYCRSYGICLFCSVTNIDDLVF
ncbi:hypothetical protein DID88_000119 [Monilinia fructigena]|uniref:Uncharacterized protein n=1 Tax=Monilinia fructigena TaxID=38457 RepID=A0A395ILU3_9HELO|nr:hypothetical protein DID88_000119 [Monilinia fructigena]